MKVRFAVTGLMLALSAAQAFAAETPAQFANGMLISAQGMTLYTFDKDSANSSNCYDGCATAWPPLLATANDKPTGDFTLVTRKDGSKQWALKGQPLYFYIADRKPGDVTGDNSGGVWHVVKNEGKQQATAKPASSTATPGYAY